jgi:hypothetical protein
MHVISQRLPARPAHNCRYNNVGFRNVGFRIVAGTALLVQWWDRGLSVSRWIDEWLVASNLTLTQRASLHTIERGSFQRKYYRQQEGQANFVNPVDPEIQHHFQLGTAQRQFPDSLSLPCFELADVEVLHISS